MDIVVHASKLLVQFCTELESIMSKQFVIGMAIILVSGLFNGSFAWPMKYARGWKWENLWLCFTFLALVLFPLLLTITFVPQLRELYATAPLKEMLPALIFGFLWGIAQATFGIAIEAVGMALAIAVVVGLTGFLGSLIPMLVLHPAEMFRPRGIALMICLPILTLAMVLYGMAGRRREKEQSASSIETTQAKMSFAAGLGICVFTGVFGALLNFGFAFSGPLQARCESLGARPMFATWAVWLLVLVAGFIPNLIYCGYLLFRNRTWNAYGASTSPQAALMGIAMAILWLGGVFGYGVGSTFFGGWGTSFGFAFLIAATVLVSNLLGLIAGEWQGTTPRTRRLLMSAVICVILAMVVLSLGGMF
jgi:L-rhamnose-H+ transport protein